MTDDLQAAGMERRAAGALARRWEAVLAASPDAHTSPAAATTLWHTVSRQLLTPDLPFAAHRLLYDRVYAHWPRAHGPAPAWLPTDDEVRASNLHQLQQELSLDSYQALYRWSVEHRSDFWRHMIERLRIPFVEPFTAVCELGDPRAPRWLVGSRLNIAACCFGAAEHAPAIVWQAESTPRRTMSYGQLQALTARVANSLRAAGLRPGDSIAVDMPMTAESVAIYLGIVAAGCTAVSIADSFAAQEIRTRLAITGAKAIFTQDRMIRGGKELPLYGKVMAADAPTAIVVPTAGGGGDARGSGLRLRAGDLRWDDFLCDDDTFTPTPCRPEDHSNVLFSSGTTGEPKAIPWTHTTPIKCAVDGHLHQDIRPGDVVAWPTSLGWMMGPWLIYAALANHATMALFDGAPASRQFGELVQHAGVSMLGVVPSLVRAWRRSGCMEGLDWRRIRAFSSTGEPSNADDYLYLMALAGYRPVIEYCGGTEIGGGYLTGTVVQPAAPTVCTTAALGSDFVLVDEQGALTDNGEVLLVPPSIGLSTTLLNQDHHQVYFGGTPALDPDDPRVAQRTPALDVAMPLRRHGDQIEQLAGGGYRIHGRVDDTMNLGGIKVSSAEIERLLNAVAGVAETAAVAVPPADGGPSRLVIFTALFPGVDTDRDELTARFRTAIRERLNPLFRIHEVVILEALPRTASNKTLRRVLRDTYQHQGGSS